jgi:hypothetical protein
MTRAVSFRVNTDPLHTEERDGFPEGSVIIEFFGDDSDFPPGTEGLKVLEQMGSIVMPLTPAIATHWDGWYFLDSAEEIDKFPNKIRDAIHTYMNQSMAVSRMNMVIGKLIENLPSQRQKDIIQCTASVCMSVALEQPIETMMQVWPKDEQAGYVLVHHENEYVAGRRFETYADAADALASSGDPGLKIGLLTVYPGGETDGETLVTGVVPKAEIPHAEL